MPPRASQMSGFNVHDCTQVEQGRPVRSQSTNALASVRVTSRGVSDKIDSDSSIPSRDSTGVLYASSLRRTFKAALEM